jgi:hypothetical protein
LNHILAASDLKLVFRRIYQNLRGAGHFIFDMITDCQPWRTSRCRIRRFRGASQEIIQRIRWEPSRRTLSIAVLVKSFFLPVSRIEIHRERTYAPAEVARWLDEAGFTVRGIHDAVTLRMPTHCPPRIIVVANKRPRKAADNSL